MFYVGDSVRNLHTFERGKIVEILGIRYNSKIWYRVMLDNTIDAIECSEDSLSLIPKRPEYKYMHAK